jgi:hypothetical protein
MLESNKEIRKCLDHAAACARSAQAAAAADMREGYLRLEKSWVSLARSYQSTQRLLNYNERQKKRKAWRGIMN